MAKNVTVVVDGKQVQVPSGVWSTVKDFYKGGKGSVDISAASQGIKNLARSHGLPVGKTYGQFYVKPTTPTPSKPVFTGQPVSESSQAKYERLGLEPIKQQGQIVGYRDLITEQSVSISSPSAARRYEERRAQQVTQATFEAREAGRTEQLQRDILAAEAPEIEPTVRDEFGELSPTTSWISGEEAGFGERYETSIQRTSQYQEPVRSIRLGAQYFVGGAVTAPIGTPRFVYSFLTSPVETAGEVKEAFFRDPVRTILEGAGGAYTFSRAGITLPKTFTSKIPRIGYTKVELPLGKGKAPVYRGVYVKVGRRAQPLIGVTKGGVKLGTPESLFLKGEAIKPGYTPATALETKLVARESVFKELGFAEPAVEAAKVKTVTKLMGMTEKQKSAFIEKQLPKEIKTLTPEGVKEVIKHARQNADVVDTLYGSFTSDPQLIKQYKRPIGDIDISLKIADEAAASEFTQTLVKRLKAKGEKVRVSEQSPTLIESFDKQTGWHHAVDIHYSGEPPAIGDILNPKAAEMAYGFEFRQTPTKIESVPVMRLSESGLRKGAASLIFQEGRLYPMAHRIKDVPDFYAIQKTLIESMKKGPLAPFRYPKAARAGRLAEKVRTLYPEIDFEKFFGAAEVEVPLRAPAPSPARPSPLISTLLESPKIIKPSARPSRPPSRPSSKPVSNVLSSISPTLSRSISRRPSPSRRPSISPSVSVPPSISPSLYPSPSKAPSKKVSPSISPSLYPSLSPSPSPPLPRSPSRSRSPYVSRISSISRPPPSPPLLNVFKVGKIAKKKKPIEAAPAVYKPSLLAVLGGITAKEAPKRVGIGIRPIILSSKRRRTLI